MYSTKLIPAFILFVSISLFSCQQEAMDDPQDSPPESDSSHVEKIFFRLAGAPANRDSSELWQFEYDNQKRVTYLTRKYYREGFIHDYVVTHKFLYSGDDSLPSIVQSAYTELEVNPPDVMTDTSYLKYANGWVIEDSAVIDVVEAGVNNLKLRVTKWQPLGNGRYIVKERSVHQQNNEWQLTTFGFSRWVNGDIVEQLDTIHSTDQNGQTVTTHFERKFTYDNHPNAFRQFRIPLMSRPDEMWLNEGLSFRTTHNATSTWDHVDQYVSEEHYTYVYDVAGRVKYMTIQSTGDRAEFYYLNP